MTTEEILKRFENQVGSLYDTGDVSEYGNYMLGGLLVEIRKHLVNKSDSLPCVSERLFVCNRCKTEYRTESKEKNIGCCIIPVDHRTSGICGGELVEQRINAR